MNCKPGDLAFIVCGQGKHPPNPENLGRVVRCIELVHKRGLGAVWQVASEGSPLVVKWEDPGMTALVEDANLQALRPHAAGDSVPAAELERTSPGAERMEPLLPKGRQAALEKIWLRGVGGRLPHQSNAQDLPADRAVERLRT